MSGPRKVLHGLTAPLKERLGRRISGLPARPPSAPSTNYRAVVHAYA